MGSWLSLARRIDGNTSDGYHTFNELYDHRHALFAVICVNYKSAWKSKSHHKDDILMYTGYFVAGVQTPKGQLRYHFPISWWDKIHCRELEHAPKWEGHGKTDAIERILSLCGAPSIVNEVAVDTHEVSK